MKLSWIKQTTQKQRNSQMCEIEGSEKSALTYKNKENACSKRSDPGIQTFTTNF